MKWHTIIGIIQCVKDSHILGAPLRSGYLSKKRIVLPFLLPIPLLGQNIFSYFYCLHSIMWTGSKMLTWNSIFISILYDPSVLLMMNLSHHSKTQKDNLTKYIPNFPWCQHDRRTLENKNKNAVWVSFWENPLFAQNWHKFWNLKRLRYIMIKVY